MSEENLAHAEQLARTGKNRGAIRHLHSLRGEWRLERGEWALAAVSLREAVSMARAVGQTDADAETRLALTQFHLGQLADAGGEAERLANAKQPAHRPLADLWLAIGDHEQAKTHALAAHKWAWADGEPYVHRYELTKARALLEKLGVPIPARPPYDPSKDGKFPCEDEVVAAIEKLRAEREAEEQSLKSAADISFPPNISPPKPARTLRPRAITEPKDPPDAPSSPAQKKNAKRTQRRPPTRTN